MEDIVSKIINALGLDSEEVADTPRKASDEPKKALNTAKEKLTPVIPCHQYIISLGADEQTDEQQEDTAAVVTNASKPAKVHPLKPLSQRAASLVPRLADDFYVLEQARAWIEPKPSFSSGDVVFLLVNKPYSVDQEWIKACIAEARKGGALVMTIIATDESYDTFPTPEFGDAVWLFNSHNQLANGVEEVKPTYNNQWEALEAILDLTNSLCREPGVINLSSEDLRSCIGQGRKLLMAKTKGQLAPRKASNLRTEQLTSLGKECCKTLGAYAAQGKNGLIQLTGGRNLSLLDIDEALEAITEELPENCDIVFGASLDMESSEDFMKIELLLEVE